MRAPLRIAGDAEVIVVGAVRLGHRARHCWRSGATTSCCSINPAFRETSRAAMDSPSRLSRHSDDSASTT